MGVGAPAFSLTLPIRRECGDVRSEMEVLAVCVCRHFSRAGYQLKTSEK